VQGPCKECRGRETFEVSESTKLRRDNILRIQVGAEDTGFAAKTKAEAFLEQEIFQGEGRSMSSGEHNCH
jgi:hypothetical protein